MRVLHASELTLRREEHRLVHLGPAVASWGAGFRWLKFFEIYDCTFSSRAEQIIVQQVARHSDRLTLVAHRDIQEGARNFAANVLAIMHGFPGLLPDEQEDAVRVLEQDSHYGHWRQFIHENEIVGISVAGLVRIMVDDRYLLMRPPHMRCFIPFGGVYTYASPDTRMELEALGAHGFVEDHIGASIPVDDFARDMRFLLPVSALPEFELWLARELDRDVNPQIERQPLRELKEELVFETNVFTSEEFDRLTQYVGIHQHVTARTEHLADQTLDLLTHLDSSSRLRALNALATHDTAEVSSKICWALEDADSAVRRRAIQILSERIVRNPAVARGTCGPVLDAVNSLHYSVPPIDSDDGLRRIRGSEPAFGEWLRSARVDLVPRSIDSLFQTLSKSRWLTTDYRPDPDLGRGLRLALSVKRIAGGKDRVFPPAPNSRPDHVGRDSWRPYYSGLILASNVHENAIPEVGATGDWRRHFIEPYDFAFLGHTLAVSVGNGVAIVDRRTGTTHIIRSPWFAQVHAIHASPSKDRLLVTSSGFDAILEVTLKDDSIEWEWFSFEQGYAASTSAWRVTRSADEALELRQNGLRPILAGPLDDLESFGIPTLHRAHVNDARYLGADRITCTIAHLGHALIIDKRTKHSDVVVTGLKAPHGLVPTPAGFVLCDTQRGRLLVLDAGCNVQREIRLAGLPAADVLWRRDGPEWLQTATSGAEKLLVLVDEVRNSLWVVDIERETYRRITHPKTWRVHRAELFDPRTMPHW